MKNNFLNGLSHIFLTFIVYIVLIGKYSITEMVIGLILSIIVGVYFSKFINIEFLINPLNWIKLLFYSIIFIKEMVKANIHMALIILNPSLPIKPSIVKAETDLKNNIGKLILSSSITLTPGTLTINIDNNNIYIHCVDENKTDEKSVKENILKTFEKPLRNITE